MQRRQTSKRWQFHPSPLQTHASAFDMTNLDMLLLKGASASDAEEYLQELRYTILTKGIPANSEGMVRFLHRRRRRSPRVGPL